MGTEKRLPRRINISDWEDNFRTCYNTQKQRTEFEMRYSTYTNGVRSRQHTGWFATKEEAEREALRHKANLKREQKKKEKAEKEKTIASYFDDYEEYIRSRPLDDSFSASERRSVLMRIKAIKDTIDMDGLTAGTINESDIRRWGAQLEEKRNTRTGTVISATYYNLLAIEGNKFIAWLNRRLASPLPPTAKIEKKKKAKSAPRQHTAESERWDYYKHEEWMLIAGTCGFLPEEIDLSGQTEPAAIADILTAQQYGFLILNFLYYEGLRSEEMRELRWRDIDFKNGAISIERASNYRILAQDRDAYKAIRTTKNHSSMRKIPMYHDEMPEDPYSDIRSYLTLLFNAQTIGMPKKAIVSKMLDARVFPSREHPDGEYTPHALDRWIRKFAKDTGLRRISIHGLRHSYAEWQCKTRNMPRDIVKDTMGHVDEDMLNMVYAPATQDEKYDRLRAWEDAQKQMKKGDS